MTKKKYTHLFFDLDNTLWDFNTNSFDALQIALEKLNLLKTVRPYTDFFKIYSDVNDRLWELYRQGAMTKKVLGVQRFEETFEKNNTPLKIGGGTVNEAYLKEMPLKTKLVDGALDILEYLHGRYDMSLITNGFKEIQCHKVQRSGLSKYFRKVFVSEEIGTQKPDKKIFEHAVKSMNARKKSSLMIGDSWDADIVGAMKFGMDQVYFAPTKEKSDLPERSWRQKSNSGFVIGLHAIDNEHNIKTPNINKPSTTIIAHLDKLFDIL